ncbi:hypothetical protein HDU79_000613 [Rhizoclosmatium sp. JEL0117]|nr:hypothetical protein HDU79_000613 [Rhizoclosmatium sp. JEL0117]
MASLTMDDSDEERMNSLLTKLFYDMPKLDPMKFNSLLLQTIKSPLIITAVDPVAEFARINVDATSCFSFSKSLMVLFVLAGSPTFNIFIAKLFLKFWLVENVSYPIVPVERTLSLIDRFNVMQPISFTNIFYLLKRSDRPLCQPLKDTLRMNPNAIETTASLLQKGFEMSMQSVMVGYCINEEVDIDIAPENISLIVQSSDFLDLYQTHEKINAESDPIEWDD